MKRVSFSSSRLLGLVLGVLGLILLHPAAGVVLAVGTYGVTTAKTDLVKLWRKVQADVATSAQFEVPEWDDLDSVPEENVDWSAREIIVPLDTQDEVGIASIEEGDYEAYPSSVSVSEATLTWILLTGSFTISKTAKWIDQNDRKAQITRQLMQQGKKKLQAMMRRVGEYFYGYSTGVMAKCATVSGAPTYGLKDAYGDTGLGSTTAPYFVANLFKVGDRVAILDPSGPAIRGFGKITAVTAATPSITLDASPGGATIGDLIVFANSLKADTATLTSTDYNKALIGLKDIGESSSIEGLATSSDAKWAAGYSTTTAQRLTGTILRHFRQGINNNGGGDLTNVDYSQGVENDVIALYQAGVRYADSFNLQVDGKIAMDGVKFRSTRFVPPGHVFGRDKKSLKKMWLLPKPNAPQWDEAYKLQDLSGFKFTIDLPLALVTDNRGNFAYAKNVTES